jgi:hypothetical protein
MRSRWSTSLVPLTVTALMAPVVPCAAAPPPPGSVQATADAERLYREAGAALAAGQLAVAERKINEANRLVPDNGPIAQRAAEIAEKRGDACLAAKTYQRAVQLALEQGRTTIATPLSRQAEEQAAKCRAVIQVKVGPGCTAAATIRMVGERGAPAPSQSIVRACQHTFTVNAMDLSGTKPGNYDVLVEQPGMQSTKQHISVHGREKLTLDLDLAPAPASPDPAREEKRQLLFSTGLGALITGATIGIGAAVLAGTVYTQDPAFVAVPVLAGVAIAVGTPGLVLVVTNLPPSGPVSPAPPPSSGTPPRAGNAAAASLGSPVIQLGFRF